MPEFGVPLLFALGSCVGDSLQLAGLASRVAAMARFLCRPQRRCPFYIITFLGRFSSSIATRVKLPETARFRCKLYMSSVYISTFTFTLE